MILMGVGCCAFGVWGVYSGEFGFNVFSPHELDTRSARVAAVGTCAMGVGMVAMGLGQRLAQATTQSLGALIASLGFAAMLFGPLARWLI